MSVRLVQRAFSCCQGNKISWPIRCDIQGGVTPIDSIVTASTVNGPSGVGQRSNPSAEWTRLVLQFAPNLAVGLHMRGTLLF